MKRYLILLIAIAILAVPVMAMIPKEPKETLTIKPTPQLTTDPLWEVPVKYTAKETIVDKIVTTFSEILGFTQATVSEPKEDIAVEIYGKTVAIIPAGSKFDGITIHDGCLKWQYGTDLWYYCEVGLQ